METNPRSVVTADFGDGAGVLDASSWSLSRSLSGGGLPGQARASAGLGTASGSVTFDVPDGRTPWRAGPILPGGPVALDASVDGGETVPVARMVARSISAGSALGSERMADLEESSPAMRAPAAVPVLINDGQVYGDGGPDASHILDRVVFAAGLRSTTQNSPRHRTHLSVPLTGSSAPTAGRIAGVVWAVWGEHDGQSCAVSMGTFS